MHHYGMPLLGKKPDHVIIHIGTDDAPHKSGSDILKKVLDLKNFTKENDPNCKKITLLVPNICNSIEKVTKENKNFIKSLEKLDMPHIINDNIIQKYLNRIGLNRSDQNRFFDFC